MSDTEKYWYAFSKLTKTSSSFVNNLYDYFHSVEIAWQAELCDLLKIESIQKRQIDNFIEERKKINPQQCMDFIKEKGINFIHQESEDYPYLLKDIDNPPIGLFVKGNLSICNLERTLAVVGSRKASENAKMTLSKILSGFEGTDICIVSGLAEGIDTVAHRVALNNNLKTIAVIGGGFDKIYPKSNVKLFNEIIDGNGAVFTEYWPDVEAISWHFPVRNRIVSGLSKGVLIAEAALKSGAMITAKLALEQGKELMCMPGLISNPNTEGIYALLKTGASLVTNTDDILDYLNWTVNKYEKVNIKKCENCSSEEAFIIDILRKDSLTLDELIIKTNLNINDLMVILTKLELEGKISQIQGERYTVVV